MPPTLRKKVIDEISSLLLNPNEIRYHDRGTHQKFPLNTGQGMGLINTKNSPQNNDEN